MIEGSPSWTCFGVLYNINSEKYSLWRQRDFGYVPVSYSIFVDNGGALELDCWFGVDWSARLERLVGTVVALHVMGFDGGYVLDDADDGRLDDKGESK